MAASGPAGSRRLDFLDVAENILQARQRLDAPIHLCAQYDDGVGQQKAEPAEEAVINAVLAADGMSAPSTAAIGWRRSRRGPSGDHAAPWPPSCFLKPHFWQR